MGEVVSVFLYLLYFPSYNVINDVIMSDADYTPGREPRSVAASNIINYPLLLLCLMVLSHSQRNMDSVLFSHDLTAGMGIEMCMLLLLSLLLSLWSWSLSLLMLLLDHIAVLRT